MRRVHQKDAGPQGLSRLGAPVDVSSGALRAGDPLGVYVHFPFCSVRCPYCDFAVDTRAEIPHDAYADAVIAELAARARWFDGAGPLVSIYFGGGTPGLWRPAALGRVITAARRTFGSPPADALEITVEVNPGETDAARLAALRGEGWRLAILTNCDDDLFATTRPRLPVPFDLVVTAQQVGSYKPDLGHFRAFADQTSVSPSNWIHVANSWVHDMLPAARMGLRKVWVDRDGTGHPAKLAERRVTSMRRLPEAVADVSAIVPR